MTDRSTITVAVADNHPDKTLQELLEVVAYIADGLERIPPHRRRQAVLTLERVERLIPIADADADDLEDPQPDDYPHPHERRPEPPTDGATTSDAEEANTQ